MNVAVERAVENTQKEERAKAEEEKKQLVEKAKAEKRESARNLLAAGVNVEVVAESLNLSIEEINEIKKKVQ